ncbi:VCBS repeat-containing protein [Streptomyces sp. NPDC050085]|uniref:VCBS repeat-containing protein n=1 Tax=Streptomyces sp. NPDC050085 TaxID=3365600 RepID=UPI003787FACD
MRLRTRVFGLGLGSVLVASAGVLTVGAPHAMAAACTAGTGSDFNGDGIRDMAIADPEATVGGQTAAGLVRIVFGGGKGTAVVSQAMSSDGADPEANDKFGFSISTFDVDLDGCTDLVAGVPYEDVSVAGVNQADAGAVYVIHGRPDGIGEGSKVDNWTQAGFDSATATEASDLFGYAVAAGTTSGKPFLAIGAPGEAIGSLQDAGCIEYMQGTMRGSVNQDDPGIAGDAEANDRFGASLAATPKYFAVGAPGEGIGAETFAGNVGLFTHVVSDGRPTFLGAASEDSPALTSGTAESGDRFGTALSMIAYQPEGAASETDALLALGTPNEDVGSVSDAGAVTVIHVKPTGAVTEIALTDRLSPDVEGEPVVGDFFGQRVALANTKPGSVGTAATIKLAVSVPNQEVGAAENAGAVHVLPGLGAPGATDKILTRGDGVLPEAAGARDFAGLGLWATYGELYVGVPYSKSASSPKGVVYAAPWSLIDGGTGTTRTIRPGADGIPDEGKAFGSSIR